jgi:hypothetical protein
MSQADNDRALVDVWGITMGGQSFVLHLMRMRHKPGSNPWVFGSIRVLGSHREVWSFRRDRRVVTYKFKGDVFTVVGADDLTYVVYQTSAGVEQYRILLSALLNVAEPVVVRTVEHPPLSLPAPLPPIHVEPAPYTRPTRRILLTQPVDSSSEMAQFVDQVLRWM